jgi:predicted small secreted protein
LLQLRAVGAVNDGLYREDCKEDQEDGPEDEGELSSENRGFGSGIVVHKKKWGYDRGCGMSFNPKELGWIAEQSGDNIAYYNFMKALLIAVMAFAVMTGLTACGTFRGMGQDLQSVGHGVQRAAEWCTPDS